MSAKAEVLEQQVLDSSKRGTVPIAVLAALLIVAFACLVYPVYVIRPFRAQGERELAAALIVLRYRIVLTYVCAFAAVLALFSYWPTANRKWKRAAFAIGTSATIAFAALCHVNIYELMFHPNVRPAFSAVAATNLDDGEKVIAVRIGSTARAYPIRSISYHHVINDVVNGAPITATY